MALFSLPKTAKRLALGLCLAFTLFAGLFLCRSLVRPHLGRQAKPWEGNARTVVLISIDGFRYDYILRGLTPTLAALADEGIMGPLTPQFPSYTFPNHVSLVTGLYPESHGIVGNAFFDPELQDFFSYTNMSQSKPHWWQAEPIWNTAEKQHLKTAILFWPGSEVFIDGRRPTYTRAYEGQMRNVERIAQILAWLDLPASARPSLLGLYLSSIDAQGHLHGPDSKEVAEALQTTDFCIKILIDGLKKRGIYNSVNLVIVSDHGMSALPDSHRIYLDELVPDLRERLAWIDYGPVCSVLPKSGELTTIYESLKKAEKSGAHFRVYLKNDIPTRLHYRNNRRIPPILIVCDLGYSIDFRGNSWSPLGSHGFDPAEEEMRALLIARGPNIRAESRSFAQQDNALPLHDSLDVYPLIASLLGISPLPNNGTTKLSSAILV